MIIVSILPILICIVGLLLFLISTNSNAKEIGKMMFFAGLLVTVYVLSGHVVRIG